ncbi:hypothetical protein AZE42_01196, partial [Rhizopogon vesiculosus]
FGFLENLAKVFPGLA